MKTNKPAEISLSDKIISIKEIREDAEIFEKANINPNLPEVIFAQDIKEAVKKILERIDNRDIVLGYEGWITKANAKEIIKSEMGERLR